VPSLVLVYHWGFIRIGSGNLLTWEGRLDLVAPEILARLSEQFLIDGYEPRPGTQGGTPTPPWDARYFIIVSAYDYADLTRQQTTLLWRLRLSVSDRSGSMDEVLPALAGGSGPFFARSFDSRRNTATPRLPGTGSETASAPAPGDTTGLAEASLISTLMKHVRDFFVGEPTETNKESRPALPPELAGRIAKYQQEKAALQGILTEKIKTQAPGPDTRRAIDLFNAENSSRIAALGRMGENIRGELAQLTIANSPPAAGQPLDVLLREFAADIRQLEPPPADTP
jgi:hypothetical protein